MMLPTQNRGRVPKPVLPGSRGRVTYEDDPGWVHERVWLWPVSLTSYIVYTPDNDMYEEDQSDYESVVMTSGRTQALAEVPNQVRFSRPLENPEMLELIKQARVMSGQLRGARGPIQPPSPMVLRGPEVG